MCFLSGSMSRAALCSVGHDMGIYLVAMKKEKTTAYKASTRTDCSRRSEVQAFTSTWVVVRLCRGGGRGLFSKSVVCRLPVYSTIQGS